MRLRKKNSHRSPLLLPKLRSLTRLTQAQRVGVLLQRGGRGRERERDGERAIEVAIERGGSLGRGQGHDREREGEREIDRGRGREIETEGEIEIEGGRGIVDHLVIGATQGTHGKLVTYMYCYMYMYTTLSNCLHVFVHAQL